MVFRLARRLSKMSRDVAELLDGERSILGKSVVAEVGGSSKTSPVVHENLIFDSVGHPHHLLVRHRMAFDDAVGFDVVDDSSNATLEDAVVVGLDVGLEGVCPCGEYALSIDLPVCAMADLGKSKVKVHAEDRVKNKRYRECAR